MKTLPPTPDNDFMGLVQACRQLRLDWPGLPAIVALCARSLGLPQSPEPEVAALLRFTEAVAQDLEALGRALAPGQEPAYHNRLHTADVMLTVSALLRGQQLQAAPQATAWAAATLAAAAAHDFAHPGGINSQPFELETRSWQAVAPHAAELVPAWRERIEQLILHTDPLCVPANHQKVVEQPFAWNLPWCQVLLNEADILVSASAQLGPGLSQALAQEWQRAGVAAHASVATPAGRMQFLRSVRFSSPAALALGMAQQVQQQLQ